METIKEKSSLSKVQKVPYNQTPQISVTKQKEAASWIILTYLAFRKSSWFLWLPPNSYSSKAYICCRQPWCCKAVACSYCALVREQENMRRVGQHGTLHSHEGDRSGGRSQESSRLRASKGAQLLGKAWQSWAAGRLQPLQHGGITQQSWEGNSQSSCCQWKGLVGFVTHAEKRRACLMGNDSTSPQSQAPE